MDRNINDWERAASVAAGAVFAALAARRQEGRALAAVAAGGLIARGVSGYCPISAAIGRNTRVTDSREALGGPRGVHVKERITIARPLHDVYAFWRNLSNLPRFMTHLERVEVIDDTRSRWTARAPAGTAVSWDAEIINEVPNNVIGWRSVGDADVISAGSVHFRPTRRGTEVVVHLQYDPPVGKLGAWIATRFGEEPSQQIRADLRLLKAFLETGEIAAAEGQPTGRRFPAHTSREGKLRLFRRVEPLEADPMLEKVSSSEFPVQS